MIYHKKEQKKNIELYSLGKESMGKGSTEKFYLIVGPFIIPCTPKEFFEGFLTAVGILIAAYVILAIYAAFLPPTELQMQRIIPKDTDPLHLCVKSCPNKITNQSFNACSMSCICSNNETCMENLLIRERG